MREVVENPHTPPRIKFLYTPIGILMLKIMSSRRVCRYFGKRYNSKRSCRKIKKYIKKHGIDMSCFADEEYDSFNAFFTRRIKPEYRPFDMAPTALVSPCDGKMSAYRITDDLQFNVKGFDYTVDALLKNSELASEFRGGTCLVIRLSETDYHRYHFFDGGVASGNNYIHGTLHSVQPVALGKRRVFIENCREVTVLDTDNFGKAVQVEVGAMLIGRIVNAVKEGRFERGEQKGMFEFGGSTVILLLRDGAAKLDDEFFENTAANKETVVKLGEKIGEKISEKA